MTVRDVYDFLNEIAPFSNQAKTDNSGFLAGDENDTVEKVLVCLDVTRDVAIEASGKKCNLVISHHPLIYQPISRLMRSNPLSVLAEHKINLICAHTNLDVAPGGIPDIMLTRLGFPESGTVIAPMNPDGTGFGKIVRLDTPLSAKALAEKCKDAFACSVVRYVDSGKPLSKIGLTSGSGGDLVEYAIKAGCDAFICGDLRHKDMILAANSGITVIDAGHFHTEDIYCEDMVARLKARFDGLDVEKAENSVDVCSYV